MEAVLESDAPSIEALDFSKSYYEPRLGEETMAYRFLTSSEGVVDALAVEEAGLIFSLRHSEVLHQKLKERDDYWQLAEETVCMTEPYEARDHALAPFDETEHNPAILASTGEVIHKVDGIATNYARLPDYHYHTLGELGGALIFLMVADLWDREPVVRHLYRTTSNKDTILPKRQTDARWLLYYDTASATAEDEFLQRLKLQFGNANEASLLTRAIQHAKIEGYGISGAYFFDGHLEAMAPRVCDALRTSKPTNLTVAMVGANTVLDWEAPVHDTQSLTGYSILRSVGGGPLAPYVRRHRNDSHRLG